MDINNKTLIITGAASGIGRELALVAIERGASVAIADLNEQGLAETTEQARAIASHRQKVTSQRLDVADLASWQDFLGGAVAEHDTIDGIINNAGIALSATLEDTSLAQLDMVMAVNFNGMVIGSKLLLPQLRQRPEAVIANVSSVFGLFPMQRNGAYCASKFAIRGFTETLAQELRGSNILVSSIHPGHIGTDIAINANKAGHFVGSQLNDAQRADMAADFKARGLPPRRAAEIILDGIASNKRKIRVGRDAIWLDRFNRLAPLRFSNWVNDRMAARAPETV